MRLLAPALSFGIASLTIVHAVATSSCASLPPLAAGVCGNGVVERDHDEDCEGASAIAATSCRPPGVVGQCHFDCGGDPKNACPAGYGCGKDAICRAGSSAFGAPVSVASPEVTRVSTGDFDGDGRDDVVAESALDVRVHYFDDKLALGTTLRVPLARARATPGHLSDTGAIGAPSPADLVVSNSGGVDVLQGRVDRTLAPTVYPAFPIPGTVVRLIALEALPQNPGVELFVMGGIPASAGILRVSAKNAQPQPIFAVPALPDKLAGSVVTGNFFESPTQSPCDEMAMAFQGESRVLVFTPCRLNGQTIELNAPPQASGDLPQLVLPSVALPTGATAKDLRSARLNADTHVDLLIDTNAGIFVAYGVGDGTFHSSAAVPAANGDGRAGAFALVVTGDTTGKLADFPLAAGDLNGDNLADFVLPRAIVLNAGDGTYALSLVAPQAWNSARIADMNGNGLRDVIASSDASIDFYNGTGTRLLNHASYSAVGTIGFMTVGDVDGDLVNDLVFRAAVADSASNAIEDDVSIIFGHALAYPDEPVIIGHLSSISEIAVAPYERSLVNENQAADDIADIAVVSKSGDALVIAALAGRADRQLTSPFFLVDGKNINDRALAPSLFATGFFLPTDASGKPHSSIASLAYDPSPVDATKAAASRLWIAPLSGAASVDTSNIRPSTTTFPAKLDYERAQMVAVDLDDASAGGREEVVTLAAPIVGGAGALIVAHFASGQWSSEELALGSSGAFRDWRLVAADVDGDGAKDVVALYGDGGARKVTVLWNTRSGHLDLNGAATSLPLPPEDAAAIACANLDRDPSLEIVMLTAKAAYSAKLDAGGRTFSSDATTLSNVGGGSALATGDVDADGVVDLVVAASGAVSIYPGISAIK